MPPLAPSKASTTRWGTAAAVLVVAFSWLAFTVPAGGFEADLQYWVRWSHRIASFGLPNVYGGVDGNANYLPVFMWILAGLNRLVGGSLSLETVPLVKVAALCFDLALGLALAWFLARRGRDPALALLVALNPATLYDSWVWGQIDAIHSSLIAGSWLALASGSPPVAAALFLAALNAKLQALAFVPLVGLGLVRVLGARPRAWAAAVVAAVAAQLALLSAFLEPRALRAVWRNVTNIVGYFPAVSLNADNLWALLVPDAAEVSDAERALGGISYRLWGELFLVLALVLVLVPFARLLWRRRAAIAPGGEVSLDHGFLYLGLAGLAFFLFPTEVHERFLHPAVVLLGIDAVVRGRYVLYAVVSACYLVNLEDVLRWRGVGYDTPIFRTAPVAIALLAAFAAGLWCAWRVAGWGARSPAAGPAPTAQG